MPKHSVLSAFFTGLHTDLLVDQIQPGGKSPDPCQKVTVIENAKSSQTDIGPR